MGIVVFIEFIKNPQYINYTPNFSPYARKNSTSRKKRISSRFHFVARVLQWIAGYFPRKRVAYQLSGLWSRILQ
jgi:hypothetical protein